MFSTKWDVDYQVVGVEPKDNLALVVSWSDGSRREYDMKPFLDDCGEYFGRLHDADYFKLVRVSEFGDTVEWPDGQDIAPESLFENPRILTA